jgi:2,4-dienoyl-CoA reductase (NADPH2)
MAVIKEFKHLLEPGNIGKVKTRNRIVKTAAGTRYSHCEDIHLTDMARTYYEALARGGSGLIIVESPAIEFPLGTTTFNRFRIDDDKFLPVFSELAGAIHKHSCPAFLQLYHSGPWHKQKMAGLQPVAASAVETSAELDRPKDKARALTIAEIEELVIKFANAIERAQKAGFDGVEINASSSHLLATFLSSYLNKREDGYGPQTLESRARFLLEIIREARNRVGRGFPISVLFSGVEAVGKGEMVDFAEARNLAQMLERATVDILHVRFFWRDLDLASMHPESLFYPEPLISPALFPRGLDWSHRGAGVNSPLAAQVKKAVSIPVIAVGRFNPRLGEKTLKDGNADFIGFCRRLMADPEMPNKLAAGKIKDVRPCMGCKECMRAYDDTVRCRVNAALGTVDRFIIQPAGKKKKVLIIGAGPAGMEAARVTAERGHSVTLYDQESRIGGLLPVAATVKGTEIEDLPALVRYFKRQISNLGVNVVAGRKNIDSVIDQVKPDVIIIAAGGFTSLPDIPGINSRKVIDTGKLHKTIKLLLRYLSPGFVRWLTMFWMPIGKRVVIIGGDIQGCELAEFLVKRKRKVTIVEPGDKIGTGLVENTRTRLLWWLSHKGTLILSGAKCLEITDEGLIVLTGEGQKQTIKADTIIPSMPLKPNKELAKILENKAPEVYVIGDCARPGLILEAISDGSTVASSL